MTNAPLKLKEAGPTHHDLKGDSKMVDFLTALYVKAVNSLSAKLKNEEGQGLVEYALILVLIAIVVIAIMKVMGRTTPNVFSEVGSHLEAR